MYAPPIPILDENEMNEMNGVDISLWKLDHQSPFGRVGGHLPLNPFALPPWWNLFSYRYERFSNSSENFQRAPTVQRLIRAEKLVDQVQKLIQVMLDSLYGHEEGIGHGHERGYRSSVTRSVSTSSEISRYRIRNHPPPPPLMHRQSLDYTQTPPPQYSNRDQDQDQGSTTTQPYSSRLYSYSCPSSIGQLTYTETIHGISKCLDALYFLIQTAQDLTDLPLVQIKNERLDQLRLNPNSIPLSDLQHEIGNTINSVISKLVTYDHGHVRRLVRNRSVMLAQLEELSGWTSELRERPFWRVEEGCEGLRRIRDWKSVKAKGVMGAIRDWMVL